MNFNNPNKAFHNAGAISFLVYQRFWDLLSRNPVIPVVPAIIWDIFTVDSSAIKTCTKLTNAFSLKNLFYGINMISIGHPLKPNSSSTPIYFLFLWPFVGTIENGLKLLNFNQYVAIRRCERLIRSFHKSFLIQGKIT